MKALFYIATDRPAAGQHTPRRDSMLRALRLIARRIFPPEMGLVTYRRCRRLSPSISALRVRTDVASSSDSKSQSIARVA